MKKDNKIKIDKKKNKVIKRVVIISLAIIIIELLIMLVIKVLRERDISHANIINDLIMDDNGYVAVGVSDFYDSNFVNLRTYEYTNPINKKKTKMITNQARIAKYDKDLNLVWENTFSNLYDANFYSVLSVSDGYIAVGSLVSRYEQIDANIRDALIVKYDLSGKMIWHKTYHVLSDTEFYKIIDDGDDNYIVVGQSIYENMEVGSHYTGGGIIVRYDKEGNLLAHNNYGGNKSGSFNDIIKVNDGYLVCGKDATNYGILVKFKKDFNRGENDHNLISKKVLWQRTYSNTDTIGFSGMVIKDNTIYLAGAINVSNEKDKDNKPIFKYDAGLVLYNTSGKYLGKYSLEDEVHHHFNSIILDNDDLILTGLINVDSIKKGNKQDSMTIKYSLTNKKFFDKKIYQEKNDYIINKIVNLDKNYFIGASKSKCSLYGCEYEPIIKVN